MHSHSSNLVSLTMSSPSLLFKFYSTIQRRRITLVSPRQRWCLFSSSLTLSCLTDDTLQRRKMGQVSDNSIFWYQAQGQAVPLSSESGSTPKFRLRLCSQAQGWAVPLSLGCSLSSESFGHRSQGSVVSPLPQLLWMQILKAAV